MARSRTQARESGPAVTPEKLVRLAKTGIGHSEAATELGVTVSQISSMAWSTALVEADRYTTVPATSANVKKLKNVEQNRWELIAARTGESVSRVKELYGDEDAVAAASSRGRKTESTTGTSRKKTSSTGSKKKTSSTSASPRRARTRAERAAARSGNPS